MDTSLLVLNVETAEKVNELWDENASIANPIFSPVHGDARLLCTSSRSGVERPLIWNTSTGERTSLQLDEIPGSIFPHAWSNDSKQILLCQIYQAQYQLYRYDIGNQIQELFLFKPFAYLRDNQFHVVFLNKP